MRPARTFDSRGSAARGAGLATLASRALLVSAAFAAASLARAQAPVGAPAPAARPPEPKPAAAAAPTGAEAPPGQAQCGVHGGHISADLPFNTTLDKTFGIDVSLEACPGHENDAVEVRMEQTTNVSYEPRVFKLKPGEWQTVDTRVLRASGGLAQVVISTAASWAPPLVVTLDAGFASSNVKANLEPTLESRVVYPVALSFVDEQDRPVSLGGPVTVQLVASKAQLREVGRADWSSRVEYPLESGANS
ncbi:MAG TPA: hypothetical protein VIW03_00205, partial [Anaeromyxobacter sp.]